MTSLQIVNPELARNTEGDRKLVDVAVGVLIRATDSAFLLTSRPAGKPYAGYWEFPGGKIEAGESVDEALKRELYEELGIHVLVMEPWKQEIVDYPHALVRLHFYKVTQWTGAIEMRELQEYCWSQLPVRVTPVLPGTLPVLQWFAHERLFEEPTVASPTIKA